MTFLCIDDDHEDVEFYREGKRTINAAYTCTAASKIIRTVKKFNSAAISIYPSNHTMLEEFELIGATFCLKKPNTFKRALLLLAQSTFTKI